MTLNTQPDYPTPAVLPSAKRNRLRRALALPSIDAATFLGLVCVVAVTAGVATFSVGAAVIVLGLFAGSLAVLIARLPDE